MDHIDDILNSDLLERYIIGEVSADEKLKVELLQVDHPIIRKKLKGLEKIRKNSDISKPSSEQKECIIKNISGKPEAELKSDQNLKSTAGQSIWKYGMALLIGGLASWLFMNHQLTSSNEIIADQEADITRLEEDLEQLSEQYAFINHTGSIPYLLNGTSFSKNSQVVIYWNEQLEKSMLRVVELPSISSDQTYQLWADVKGQMLSLGVFDAGQAIIDAIPMNYLNNATSLNITVEPIGGSEHPTVANLTASITI